jgi:hypothetical protein
MGTGPQNRCIEIELANPTAPNIAYLRRRFGPRVCVDLKAGGRLDDCGGLSGSRLPTGSATVPDLRDLGIYEASRRAVASGLGYTVACLRDNNKQPKRPTRYSPEQLVRITTQCPRAGERVPPGTAVALNGVALLPGGFTYKVGPLAPYGTGTSKACADGRNASRHP